MYLSRVELDISKKQTQVALSARNKLHGAIENAFFCEDDERLRNLWRIDKVNGKMYLLLCYSGTSERVACKTSRKTWFSNFRGKSANYGFYVDDVQ